MQLLQKRFTQQKNVWIKELLKYNLINSYEFDRFMKSYSVT